MAFHATPTSDLKVEKLRPLGVFEVADRDISASGRLGADLIERRDAGGDKHVAANQRALADPRVAAEDGGPGIDGDIVLDGGMALVAAKKLRPNAGAIAPRVTP